MALYFFEFVDGSTSQRDDIGTECPTFEAVQQEATRALVHIAKDEIPADSERRFFTVVVRDVNDRAVYTATLAFSGMRLDQRPQ